MEPLRLALGLRTAFTLIPIFTWSGGAFRKWMSVVEVPSSRSDAPPGYYMLFIVDTSGRPSEAHFVRLILAALPSLDRVPLAALVLVFGALAALALSRGRAAHNSRSVQPS